MPLHAVRVTTLKTNREKRNAKIKEEFRKRYTDAARPRMYSREYVLAQIADEKDLSIATVEDIIYAKAKPTTIAVAA